MFLLGSAAGETWGNCENIDACMSLDHMELPQSSVCVERIACHKVTDASAGCVTEKNT